MSRAENLTRPYPGVRPELPPQHQEIYVEHYRANRAGASGAHGVVRRLESWMHRLVAEGCGTARVLEIGAGTLNHVPYHPQARKYDAVEPFRELWEDNPVLSRI